MSLRTNTGDTYTGWGILGRPMARVNWYVRAPKYYNNTQHILLKHGQDILSTFPEIINTLYSVCWSGFVILKYCYNSNNIAKTFSVLLQVMQFISGVVLKEEGIATISRNFWQYSIPIHISWTTYVHCKFHKSDALDSLLNLSK